jgi:hypothetical protein
MQVAKGTQSIGDAFKDMAINFGQMLMQEVMRAAIGKVLGNALTPMFSQTGGIVGKQRGGIIRAENGTYIPGNRTGDRNLALLEDGEYVLNREAVAAIGVNNLNSLNYGMAPRFQSGGGFGLSAQQALVGDESKYTGILMESGKANKAIDMQDYTAYAYAEDAYFKDMREKSIQAEQERIQKVYQDKVKNLQLMTSIMGAVGSLALGAGMAGQAAKTASSAAQLGTAVDSGAVKATTQQAQVAMDTMNSAQLKNFISKNPSDFILKTGEIGGAATWSSFANLGGLKTNMFGNFTNKSFSNALSNAGISRLNATNMNMMQPFIQSGIPIAKSFGPNRQTGGLVGYQSGGFIPYGSRISDNVPRYMSGGINLMNNASKKYVMGNTPRFQDGGSNGISNTTNNSTNSTNIAINIDKSGTTVIGESGNNYSSNDYQFSKDLAKVVAKIADSRISDAQRSGGQLARTKG